MHKQGFTLIELLVSIVVLGVLGGLASQSFDGFRQGYRFQNELEQGLQIIREARNNAMVRKNCLAEDPADFWQITLSVINQSRTQLSLACFYTPSSGQPTEQSFERLDLDSGQSITLNEKTSTPINDQAQIKMRFFPGGLRTELWYEPTPNDWQAAQTFQLLLQSNAQPDKPASVLCFDAIKGFPLLLKNETQCP